MRVVHHCRFTVREEGTEKVWECTFSNAIPFPSAKTADKFDQQSVVLAQYPDPDGQWTSTLYPADVITLDTESFEHITVQFRRDKKIADVPCARIAFLTRKMRGRCMF